MELVENAGLGLRRNSAPRVLDRDPDSLGRLRRGQRDRSLALRKLDRVVKEIRDDLLDSSSSIRMTGRFGEMRETMWTPLPTASGWIS